MNSKLIILLLSLFVSGLVFNGCKSGCTGDPDPQPEVPDDEVPTLRGRDSLALVALYKVTDGEDWEYFLGDMVWESVSRPLTDAGNWRGVTTRKIDGELRVVELRLPAVSMSPASLPAEIGNLTALEALDLSYNNLEGVIPESITNLTQLKELHLNDNNFDAQSVDFIKGFKKLEKLYLDNNRFHSLPAEIGDMTGLTYLNIAGNQFTGLPSTIGNLKALQYLYAENNQLTDFPEEGGQMENLIYLFINQNQLTVLPECILGLKKLIYLKIDNNQISGLNPQEIFSQLPVLKYFDY